MAAPKHGDEATSGETTGHEWDGIRELNTPLPRWWLWTFYVTIAWAVGYWVVMPAWPLVSGHTKGLLGYSERARLGDDMVRAEAAQAGLRQRIKAASLEEIRTSPELLAFALAGGRSAFSVHCSQCHGAGAQGFAGFPNLNDDDWLWGGRLDDIHHTISHGVRNETDRSARVSDMPAFLKDGILTAKEINDVAEHVLALGQQPHDAAAAERGAAIFAENCVACHGEGGEGNAELGAPRLNDAISLYGVDKADVFETIAKSRGGVMPAWGRILDPVTVKQLTLFVHSLGGGR